MAPLVNLKAKRNALPRLIRALKRALRPVTGGPGCRVVDNDEGLSIAINQTTIAAAMRAERCTGIVPIRNDEANTIYKHDVVTPTGSVYAADDSRNRRARRKTLSVEYPSSDAVPVLVVHSDTVESGKLGHAVASGVVFCAVYINNTDHKYAKLDSDGTFVTATSGYPILFAPDTPAGLRGCIINLGGGGGSSTSGFFPVQVTQDGGSGGDDETQASWTYTVRDLDSNTLGSAMAPTKARPSAGALVAGTGVGIGYYAIDGSFVLYDANETLDTEACG
jgi:hypothetical protein